MSAATLSCPVFDADNHMYETTEALTKHLPDRYKGAIDYVDVRGRTKIVVRGQISDYIPNPTFDVVARPGVQEDYFRHGNPEGKSRREIFGEPMRAIPAFREPAPRLELMDEQGIDRALMFPTLASLVEERIRDDPELIHVVIHALNEWMHETWQFDYEGRIFATPVITLPIVEKAIEELEWVVERGARAVLIRPAPVPGFRGPRSFGLPEFDPFWEKVVEHDVLVAMHSSDSGYERYTNDWMGSNSEMLPFQPQAFRMLSQWRPIEDAVGALICHGALSRFPQLKVAVIENGSSWVEPLIKSFKDLYKKMPQDFAEDPVEVMKRNVYVSPFWEEDLVELAGLIGEDHVLFGSDYPHPEGLADPASYVSQLEGAPEQTVRKIMGGNLARLGERRGHGPPVIDGDDPAATIPSVTDAAASRFGDRVAISDGTTDITYAALLEEARTFGAGLVAAGIEPGDRVAMWAPNGREWIVALLGLFQAGAVLVPVNTRFKGQEAADILRRSGARALVTVTDFLGTDHVAMLRETGVDLPDLHTIVVISGPVGEGTTSWDAFRAAATDQHRDEVVRRAAAVAPDDPSDILFTSGTTGAPKGVVQTHDRTLLVASDWVAMTGLTAGDRYLMVNPYFHMFGLKAGILASLVAGATMLPEPVFDVDVVLARAPKEQVTVLPGAPTIYQAILDHPSRDQHDLSSLRVAVTGAADIPVELIRRIHDELPFSVVITGYGLTEGGTAAATSPGDDPETIATTVGRPRPGFELRIVDDQLRDVAAGEPGEILLRGGSVMSHYLDDADATAAAVTPDGWLRTGDLGTVTDAGCLRIVGRSKDMFIVGGFNAYPAEIENALLRHPDIQQVAVIGIPDERLGEVGMAFVVARPGTTPTEDEIISWSREQMANYKAPRRVELVSDLPVNATGKVVKDDLRARVSSTMTGLLHHGLEQAAARHGARDAVRMDEEAWTFAALDQMANAFARHLATQGVGPHDRVAMMMANRVEFVVAVNGISKLGAAAVLLSPAWKAMEVDHALGLTTPVHAVTDGDATALLSERLGKENVTDLDDPATRSILAGAADPPSAAIADTDESVLVFSSGTTGMPKAVRHTHRSLSIATDHWVRSLGLTPDDRFQVATPPSHILGLLNLLAAASAGATVRLHRRFDLDEVLRRIESDAITLEMAVAPIALAMANHPSLESFDLSSLRYIMWGATPVSESVAQVVSDRSGVRWLPAYGASELPVLAVNPVDQPDRWRLDSAGLPPEGVELRVVDLDSGTVLPAGEVGEIQARSQSVMAGYLPDDANADAFDDGWYRTGDVGWLEPEGWVHLTDRSKEMIKVSGFQVAPAEVEAVLHAHPSVLDCAVFGLADDRAGEVPVAAVVVDPTNPVTADDLKDLVAGSLATYKHLRHVVLVDAVPRLPSGKVLRRTLREEWTPTLIAPSIEG